jgi:hypothetical protein
MQHLVEVIVTYMRETRRLESLPSSTETSFAPVEVELWNFGRATEFRK